MRRNVLCSLLAVLLIPVLLSAYTIVLKNGQRIEAQGRYVVEGNLAKFTDSTGRQRQVPVGEIDVVATERANAAAATSIPVPRAAEGKRGPKVWTNDEIERLVRGETIDIIGTLAPPPKESEAAAEGESAAAPEEQSQPQPPKEQTREYWDERMKPLREDLAKVEREIQTLRSGEGRAVSNAVNINANDLGPNVDDVIRQLERRRAEIQRRIEAVQDDARRTGVPANWVR